MQPQIIGTENIAQPQQATHVDGHLNVASVHEIKRTFNHNERAHFYTGEERITLQNEYILRVRELQESNDNLQREIVTKEKQMVVSSDPLSILADVEHSKIMIARNTGEIVKIYIQDEERRKRIAELEEQNAKLRVQMIATQGKFITNHNMQERTQHAADFFLTKATYERNLAELIELCQA